MANMNAPPNAVITMGTRAGGTGPFVPVAVLNGRYVINTKFPFLTNVLRRAAAYITIPTTIVSAGNLVVAAPQVFTWSFQTANRFTVSIVPAIVFYAVAVVTCATRGGVAYTRVYIAPEPVAL